MGTRWQDRRFPTAWLAIVALGVGWKLLLLSLQAFPFHADEAVVGLMARHILAGRWPAFFYGQAYMGSLDASLVALAYQLAGEASVPAIRLVQTALYALTIVTAMLLADSIFNDRRVALFAGALLAIPTVNLTLYTTVSLGGYGEALLIGNLLLLTALRYRKDPGKSWLALAWGGLAGFGLWAFGITLVFSLPSGVVVARTLYRSHQKGGWLRPVALLLLAAAAGAAPWWLTALRQGPQAFVSELLGSAIAGASPAGALQAAGSHLLALLLFGPTVIIGLRPPWGTDLLAQPLAPAAAAAWLFLAYQGLRALRLHDPARTGRWTLLGVAGVTVLGLVITPFGGDPSGRYFLPLAVPLALLAAEVLARLATKRWAWAILGTVLSFNLWGTLQAARQDPPGLTTQFNPETRIEADRIPELARALEALGERRGYTTYWVAYPLAFHSEEQLIFVPRLPYHLDLRLTERDNRYAPYNSMVESSERVAYITARHPELEARLRAGLERAGAGWRETELGEFRIFHSLSTAVRPEMLDLAPADQ